MSIRALADLAVDRDRAQPGSPVAQYTDVLTKAIPTESLAAYTAYIAVVQTVTSEQNQYMPARWWAFGGFVALTLVALLVAYYRKLKQARWPEQDEHPIGRWLPITELAPAIFAASAWGLALPGGPPHHVAQWRPGRSDHLSDHHRRWSASGAHRRTRSPSNERGGSERW